MPEFVVLRNSVITTTSSPFENFEASTKSIRAPLPPEPRVELHDIGVAEASVMALDPRVAAVARPMPVALIQPDAVAAIAAGATSNWGVAAVKADASSQTGDGVVVAVLDTGIDSTHDAFAGMTLVEKDFTGSGNGDRHGHGTHTAGTIFGRDVGGARIGVARGVKKALIGKVLDDRGGGNSDMVFRGIEWALGEGAHVISMSLGFDFAGAVVRMQQAGMPLMAATSSALEAYRSNLRFFDALMRMIEAKGAFGETAVVVAATGNEADRPNYTVAASLPAAAAEVVSVAALGRAASGKFNVARFSNTMPQIAAPGVDIVSARTGGGLQSMSGTSMACPHVAGVAALWWEALKKSGTVQASANLVVGKMMAGALTADLDAAFGPIDRGTGLVVAPP